MFYQRRPFWNSRWPPQLKMDINHFIKFLSIELVYFVTFDKNHLIIRCIFLTFFIGGHFGIQIGRHKEKKLYKSFYCISHHRISIHWHFSWTFVIIRCICINFSFLNGGHFEIQDGRHNMENKIIHQQNYLFFDY